MCTTCDFSIRNCAWDLPDVAGGCSWSCSISGMRMGKHRRRWTNETTSTMETVQQQSDRRELDNGTCVFRMRRSAVRLGLSLPSFSNSTSVAKEFRWFSRVNLSSSYFSSADEHRSPTFWYRPSSLRVLLSWDHRPGAQLRWWNEDVLLHRPVHWFCRYWSVTSRHERRSRTWIGCFPPCWSSLHPHRDRYRQHSGSTKQATDVFNRSSTRTYCCLQGGQSIFRHGLWLSRFRVETNLFSLTLTNKSEMKFSHRWYCFSFNQKKNAKIMKMFTTSTLCIRSIDSNEREEEKRRKKKKETSMNHCLLYA